MYSFESKVASFSINIENFFVDDKITNSKKYLKIIAKYNYDTSKFYKNI